MIVNSKRLQVACQVSCQVAHESPLLSSPLPHCHFLPSFLIYLFIMIMSFFSRRVKCTAERVSSRVRPRAYHSARSSKLVFDPVPYPYACPYPLLSFSRLSRCTCSRSGLSSQSRSLEISAAPS